MEKSPEKSKESSETDRTQALKFMVFQLATEFGFLIAVPLLVFVLLGRKLDASHHTKYYSIIGIFLALGISSIMIGKKINDIRKKLK